MRSDSAARAVSPDSQPVASTDEASVASRLRDEPSSATRSSRVPEATGTAAMRRIPLGSRAAEVAPGPRSVTPVAADMLTRSPATGEALMLGRTTKPVDAGDPVRVVAEVGVDDGDADALGVAVEVDVGVVTAVDDVAITVPPPALMSWAPLLTGPSVCGTSWAMDGAGGGGGAVPKVMWMSLAASWPLAASVALCAIVTEYGVLPVR